MSQLNESNAESAENEVTLPSPTENGVEPSSPGPVVLTFHLAGHTYGLPVADVVQIIEMSTITPLPQLPPALKGIINFHGQMVPVMDLRRRFGLPDQSYGLHTPIILVNLAGQILGVVVDEVEAVLEQVSTDQNDSQARLATQILNNRALVTEQPVVSQLVRANRQLVPLLEVKALLTNSDQSQLDQRIAHQQTSGAPV
jgi:purine-binding chemotaxis protein CheW